jgi:hypothetical protein
MSRRTFAVGWVVLVAVAGQARAELRCAAPGHHAGNVRGGALLSHAFTLVNDGPGPVEVTAVRPGCSCSQPRLDRRTFAPGEQAQLTLTVHTVTQASGPNAWRVVVHSTRAGRPHELALTLTAVVERVVFLSPASLLLSTQTTATHAFTLTEKRDKPLTVTAAAVASPHVRTRITAPRRQPDGTWARTIELEVLPTCPEGRHEDALHVRTDDPAFADLQAPFTVLKRPRGAVSAAPASVQLQGRPGQPLPARIVLLSGADDRPVRVECVEADSPAVRCTWAPGPGARATLRVVVDGAMLAGEAFQATLRVHLAEPAGVVVTVPVGCVLVP